MQCSIYLIGIGKWTVTYTACIPLQKRSQERSTGKMAKWAKVGKMQCVKGTDSWISSIWVSHSEMLRLLWPAIIHAVILICDVAYVCWFLSNSLRPLSQKLNSAEIKRLKINQKRCINVGRSLFFHARGSCESGGICPLLLSAHVSWGLSFLLCSAGPIQNSSGPDF